MKLNAIYTVTLILLFACSKPSTNNNIKIDQLEELLLFYPQKGEKELNIFLNSNTLTENDKYKTDYLKGILDFKKSNTDTAVVLVQKAFYYFQRKGDIRYMGKSKLLLGNIAEKVGSLNQALEYYREVIETAKANLELGHAYLGVSRCQIYLHGLYIDKNYELDKGIELLKKIGKKEYDLYADYVGCALTLKGNQQKQKLKNIAKAYISLGIKENASSVYKSLANIYLKENNLDSSAYYINKAVPLSLSTTGLMASSIYQIKGAIGYRCKDFSGARKDLEHALKLGDSLNQQGVKYYVYKTMANVDSAVGDSVSSYFNKELSKVYLKLRGETRNNKKMSVDELWVKMEIQKEELEKKKLQRVVFGLVVLILVCIIFIIQRKRKYAQEQHQMQRKRDNEQNEIERKRQQEQNEVERKRQQEQHELQRKRELEQHELQRQRELEQHELQRKRQQEQYELQVLLDREKHKNIVKEMRIAMVELGQNFDADDLEIENIKELLSFAPEEPTPLDLFAEAYAEEIQIFKKRFPRLTESDVEYALMFYVKLPMKFISFLKEVNGDTIGRVQRRMRSRLELKKGTDLRKYFLSRIKIEIDKNEIENILKNKGESQNGKEIAINEHNSNDNVNA